MQRECKKRPRVAAAACEKYDADTARAALLNVISDIDGLSWLRPGMKIAIKANLVTAKKAQCSITNGVLITELARILVERGASVIVGDSPGGPFTGVFLSPIYQACGLNGKDELFRLNHDYSERRVNCPEARVLHEFDYTSYLDEADAIINFCKLKTHGMLGLTCAVKNMFGVVPGSKKQEMHYRFPETQDFADMIIDLYEYTKPVLNIVDAVVTMEGNGPTQGEPRYMGALLASTDAYALDVVCASLIGMEPSAVPTIAAAEKRGLSPEGLSEIELIGDPMSYAVGDFSRLQARDVALYEDAFRRWVTSVCFRTRPALRSKLCKGCNGCARLCPAHAITMRNALPVIDKSRCIRCFCCQEFCPTGALYVHRTVVSRVLQK